MGYSGSVPCRCVAEGRVVIPPELAGEVTFSEKNRVHGPSYGSPLWKVYERWSEDACPHPRFKAVRIPVANNRTMDVLDQVVQALLPGEPDILALARALPRHHGHITRLAEAQAALPGVDRVLAGLDRVTVSGLNTEDVGLLFWSPGSRMRIWLSGGEQDLVATVEDGVIGIRINNDERIRARTLHITPTGEGDEATFTDPETGTQALALWPYECRTIHGYTGPLPADEITPLLDRIRLLLTAATEQGTSVWWG